MTLREIAAIAGRPGLFRILKPTHGGVIVEALDTKAREAVGASQRLSILSEISMYTTTAEGSEPLPNILAHVATKHNNQKLALTAKADGADLEAFFAAVLPDWDRERVYLSDIKKLVTWYNLLAQHAPEALKLEATEETAAAAEAPAAQEAKPKAKAKKAAAESAEAPAEPKKPAAKKKKEADL